MEFTEFKRVLTQFLNGRAMELAPIGSPNAGTLAPPSKYPKLKVPQKFPTFPNVPPTFPKFAKGPPPVPQVATGLPSSPTVPLNFRF
jgi:hypothetical protein